MRAAKNIVNMHGDILANAGESLVVLGANAHGWAVQLECGAEVIAADDEITDGEVEVSVKLVDLDCGLMLEHGAVELAQRIVASAPAIAQVELVHREGELVQVKTSHGSVFTAMPRMTAGGVVVWRARAAEGLLKRAPAKVGA